MKKGFLRKLSNASVTVTGLRGGVATGNKIGLSVRGGMLDPTNIDNIDADITTGRFGVEWFPWENWGASLDYTMRRIEADAQRNSFDGNFRFIDSGLRLGVVYRF